MFPRLAVLFITAILSLFLIAPVFADEIEDLQKQIDELSKAREQSQAATKPLEGQLDSLKRRRKMTHALTVNQGLQASDLESESKLTDTEDLLKELINTGSKIFYMGATLILKSQNKEASNHYDT